MSQKRDQRLVQSEHAIIEAGISTLLLNPAAGMSDIAAASGVGRATLYRHFATREALIRKLALVCLEEIDRALAPYAHLQGRAAIEQIVEVLMPLADRFSFLVNLWSLVEDDDDVRRINTRMQRETCALIDQARRAGEISTDLPTSWLALVFDNTLATGWKLVEAGEATSSDAARYVRQSFFDGCGEVR
jgi:AcrR family transcriptional regulator